MSKSLLVTLLLVAAASAQPLVYNAPFYASPYSAAYVNPGLSPVGAVPAISTAVPSVAAAVPGVATAVPGVAATYPATVPFSSVSAYSYGSSYSVQDYFPTVVNPSPSLAYSAAYSLPYAYAADYFYRR